MRSSQGWVLGGGLQGGLVGNSAPHTVVQGVPCMAMVLLGRPACLAVDVVLHLPSEAIACWQVLL